MQVKTLGIKREQVCTSVRTVSGGWGVLHCAVRSQDLATLQVGVWRWMCEEEGIGASNCCVVLCCAVLCSYNTGPSYM